MALRLVLLWSECARVHLNWWVQWAGFLEELFCEGPGQKASELEANLFKSRLIDDRDSSPSSAPFQTLPFDYFLLVVKFQIDVEVLQFGHNLEQFLVGECNFL